jgi:hypothetical protein
VGCPFKRKGSKSKGRRMAKKGKILRIYDDAIDVGSSDGNLINISRDDLTFDPKLGQKVEIFQNDSRFMISVAKKKKKKHKNLSSTSEVKTENSAQDSEVIVSEKPILSTYNQSERIRSSKSKMTAGLLGIFFGGFGIHSFYTGRVGRGFVQLFVTMVTFGIGSIWGFIEGIVILCSHKGSRMHEDAWGRELRD